MSSGNRNDPTSLFEDQENVLDNYDSDEVDYSEFLEEEKHPDKFAPLGAALALEFAAARAGDKIKVGDTEVLFDVAPSGAIKPAQLKFSDGSTLSLKYAPTGSILELTLKDSADKVREKLSSENGKDFTHEIDGQVQAVRGSIEHDGKGNFSLKAGGAVETTRIFKTDGSIVSRQPKGDQVEEAITNLDRTSRRRSIRNDGTMLETSYAAGTPPKPLECRLLDQTKTVRQIIAFDQASRPAKITLFEGSDQRLPSAIIEPVKTDYGLVWQKTEGTGNSSAKVSSGSVEIGSDGRVIFTPRDASARPTDKLASKADLNAEPPKIETVKIDRATVDLEVRGDRKLPRLVQYDSMNKVEFVMKDSSPKEVKVTQNGKESVWESTDGLNFKLRGATPEVTAIISYDNGKVTIDSTSGGKPDRQEFHPDGSSLSRAVDAKNNVWTTVRAADGTYTEDIHLDDKRRITRKYDRNGANQATIFDAQGKAQIAYVKVTGTNDWLKYDLSEKPPKPVAGKLSFEVSNPEPKFSKRDASDSVEAPDSAEQKRVNLEGLQSTLIGAFPATAEGDFTKIKRDFESKFVEEVAKLKLPENMAVWTQEHRKQLEDLRNKLQQEQNEATDTAKTKIKERIEAVEAERKRGEFGPATKKMYQEYVDWLQTTGLPAYMKMQAQMMSTIPADSPRKLPVFAIPGVPNAPRDYLDPATFRAQAVNERGLPPISLDIDTTKDGGPSFEDLQKLGKALLWMDESQKAIEENRRHFEVNTLIPESIAKNGLPDGWHFKNYPGRDPDAYKAAYHRMSDVALRTRNLIVTAVDSDKLNLAQSHNWFARDVSEIRRDLGIPAEWTLEIDPKTKKITKLDLNLPDTLDANDPIVKEKLAKLEAWLAGPGKKIETAVEDAIAKEKDPSKFLFWGTSEMPKGYKFKGSDGREVDCNVLQCDLSAEKRNGKIVVKYSIQPQNAHLLSYQNLPAFCSDAGAPFVEERTYEPDEFVMVRHGMEGVQMVKAKDLDSWISSEKFKYRAEKGLSAAMDIGMIVSGTYELKAVKTATEIGAKEAIKLTAREMVMSRALGWYRIGLGATGVLNNAAVRQWSPGGHNIGQWLLDARGLAFVADVAIGLPSQIKALAGAGKGLEAGTRLWKLEEASQTFSSFHKLAGGANKLQMTLANFGFAPMIFSDIYKQAVTRPDMQSDLDGLRDANAIINGLEKLPSNGAMAEKRLYSYADHLDLPPAQSQEANKIISEAAAVLKKPASPQRETELQQEKEKLVDQIKNNKDKNIQLIAAATLLTLCRNEKGRLPDGALVSKDGKPVFDKEQLNTLLTELAAAQDKKLLALELKVQLGKLHPAEYGKALKDILDNKSLPQADKTRQWAAARTEYVDKLMQQTYAGANPGVEVAISRKVLESYEEQIAQTADPATKAELGKIAQETARLLELREKDPAAFEKEAAEFKAKLMVHFRTDNGAKVAEFERTWSNRQGVLKTATDATYRAEDIKAGGPKDANKDLQIAAAAALLLLNRDKSGKLDTAAVAASREITVPGFKYRKDVSEETGTGSNKKKTRKTIDAEAPPHQLKQTVTVEDLIGILKADSTKRESGSRRLVSADTLFHAGTLDVPTYASILKDALIPPPGMKPPTAEDRQWSLERIGFLANAQRAQEVSRQRVLDADGRKEEAGKSFGVSSQDLEAALAGTASNPSETADNRARAAYILRALKEKPDVCQELLKQMVADTKGKECEKVILEKLKADLDHPDVENRFRAAHALDMLGKINKLDFNEVMMQCFDSANPDLRARAVKALKAESPDDLTGDQRQRLFNLLRQPPADLHQPAQVALLEKIHKIANPGDVKELTENIVSFISPDSMRRAKNSTDLRVAAIKALGMFNHTGVSSRIEACLNDQSAKVRIAAMQTLAKIGPEGLDKVLDARREKENDFAARQVLDDLRFSVPRLTDAAAYKKQWEKLDQDMPKAWYKADTSGTSKGIDSYLEGKFGKEKNSQNHNESLLLYDWDNLVASAWYKHTGDNSVGDTLGRGFDRLGRFVGYAATWGNVDTNPYDEANCKKLVEEWRARVHKQIEQVIEDANSEHPDQAIAALAYVARNGAEKFSKSIRAKVETDFSQALIDIIKAGKPGADLAMREIYSSLTDKDISVVVRQRYLNALMEFQAAGKLTKEQAAHIIFKSMNAELERTASKAPPDHERVAAVNYWRSCLAKIKSLNPAGYLGPHYDGGVVPVLQHMAYNHPFKEIRDDAKLLVGRMQDSAVWRLRDVEPEKGVKQEDAARRIDAVLKNSEKNPDEVIREMSRVMGDPITEANDPRIKALQNALKVNNEKVRIAAASLLGEFRNKNIPADVKLDAVRAMALVEASGIYHNNSEWKSEASLCIKFLHPEGEPPLEWGTTRSKIKTEELERLRNTPPARKQGEDIAVKLDGSVLHYNKENQISKIQYPRIDMAVAGINLTWEGGALKSLQHPDGKTWTREFKEGKPTNVWLQDGKEIFRGDITIKPDGTIILDKIKESSVVTIDSTKKEARGETTSRPESYTILYTDGRKAMVEYNDKGKPAKVTPPSGEVTEYKYDDAGNLTEFNFIGNKNPVKDGLAVAVRRYDYAEIRVGPRGEHIVINNDGMLRSWSIEGVFLRHYEGPPKHVQKAVKELNELQGANLTAEKIIERINSIMDASGSILYDRDPRIAFFKTAMQSPNSKVAEAAQQLLDKYAFNFQVEYSKTEWDFSDTKRSFAERFTLATRAITDHSLGDADPARRTKALEFLAETSKDAKASENHRMECINILLKESAENPPPPQSIVSSALEGLARIAASASDFRQTAIEMIKGLNPEHKLQALDHLLTYTEVQLQSTDKPSKDDMEQRLALIVDEYVASKGDVQSEANLWRMMTALAGNLDSESYRNAYALIDRRNSFPFKPIAGDQDPRIPYMKKALESADTNLKLSAALALTDKTNGKLPPSLISSALNGLAKIATADSSDTKQGAIDAIKGLSPEQKTQALQYYLGYTERQLSGKEKPSKDDLEQRLALIVDHYGKTKSDLQSEAFLWQTLAALAGNLDSEAYKNARALIERPGAAPFKPIADEKDPRIPQLKKALESNDTKLKVNAALALTDRTNSKDAVDKITFKDAFEQVLYKQLEETILAANKLEKSDNRNEKVSAWTAVESLYKLLEADPQGLNYTYATMKRTEAQYGPAHRDLLPLYERLAKLFAEGKDPMQAEEYRRKAAVLRGDAPKPTVEALKEKLEVLTKQLSTADERAAAAHIANMRAITKGIEEAAGRGTKATGEAYKILGDACAKYGDKDESVYAYEQAATALELAKEPASADVLGVLAKHYAGEKNLPRFKATKDRILQVSRWKGTQEANITSHDRLLELAEYLTSQSSTEVMQGEAEDLLAEAVKLGKQSGEGSNTHIKAMDAMSDFYRHPNISKNGKAAELMTSVLDMQRGQNGGQLTGDLGERARDLADLKAKLGQHNASVDLMEEVLRAPTVPPAVAQATRQQYVTMLRHYGYHEDAAIVAQGGLPPMWPNMPGPDSQGPGRYRGGGGAPGGLGPGGGPGRAGGPG